VFRKGEGVSMCQQGGRGYVDRVWEDECVCVCVCVCACVCACVCMRVWRGKEQTHVHEENQNFISTCNFMASQCLLWAAQI